MSTKNTNSLHFYDYICQKIGPEEEVKCRRLTFIARDISDSTGIQISSGSRSEGLDLKGSDIDLMYIDPSIIVYEYEREAVQRYKTVLIMETAETQPCFTRLSLYTNYKRVQTSNKQMLEQHGRKYMMSSELFKLAFFRSDAHLCQKIHGPCISDEMDIFDFVVCLKCDKWISQAAQWSDRPRSSWLSTEIISKITMSGILFVPIGSKGSKHEDLEWRISFSVAEKFLIFSFNHTQLLCYALLKIVLKEIIEKNTDLQGLLCSYHLKTLMFWILDESDPNNWRPNNTIQCFLACLRRLLYNIEYSTLLHYFIPDYNLFELRFCTQLDKKKLTNLLQNLYQQGIQCFSVSETLRDYSRFPTEMNTQLNKSTRLVHNVLNISCSCPLSFAADFTIPKQLYSLLHRSKTYLSKSIFIYFLSRVHQCVENKPYTQHKGNNKQQCDRYKYDLSHLLIGLHSDAVAGWLVLASYFYVHNDYFTSLRITNYALSKFTDERRENRITKFDNVTLKHKCAINMMEKESLITTLRSLTINTLWFAKNSSIIPKELNHDVIRGYATYISLTFAHFLRFLCFYHLHDIVSCENVVQNLNQANFEMQVYGKIDLCCLQSTTLVGIAEQMIGQTDLAKHHFTLVAECDDLNLTIAARKLRELRMEI